MGTAANAYWSRSAEDVARELGSGAGGLASRGGGATTDDVWSQRARTERALSSLRLLYEQVKSPLIWILAFAAVVSIVAGEYTDSAVVLAILVTSTGVGFWRERGARDAVARLRARLTIETEVIRGGVQRRISAADVVPGDLVVLSAGALVPADGLLWEATDLHVNEAILTGETFPAEKRIGPVDAGAPARGAHQLRVHGDQRPRGTARGLIVCDRKVHRLRRDRRSPAPAAARDRVRSRRAPVRRLSHQRDDGPGHRRVRREHAARASGRRDAAVLDRPRGGAQPGAAAGDSERRPRPARGRCRRRACW